MGHRPSSTLIYGFTYTHDWNSDDPDLSENFTYERDEEWEGRTLGDTSRYTEEGRALLRAKGQHVCWGAKFDDPCHAFGLVLAEGDWDMPCVVDPEALLLPANADHLIREVCEFYGVPFQEPRLLLLSSYG